MVVVTLICFVGRSYFIYVICTYTLFWCPTQFPYQIMLVAYTSNTLDSYSESITGSSLFLGACCLVFSCLCSVLSITVCTFVLFFR